MKNEKHSPVAQIVAAPAAAAAAAAAVSVSTPSAAPAAEAETRPKAPYAAPVYPYTPSRKEKREYVHAKLKGEPIWVNEPLWIKQRKENHERSKFQSNSANFSTPPQEPTLSPPRRHLSPKFRPFTPRAEIPPPPKLKPLLFATAQRPTGTSTDKEAAHAEWWARLSNRFASHSARSYHLFIASSFLTCQTEELLLLYEVRKLNADGKRLFEEVLRGLRARAASWEGSMDELRISWDMTSKLEMVLRYDAFVAEQVARLERELRGRAGRCDDDAGGGGGDGGSEAAVDGRAWQEECATEDSGPENSPTETSPRSETDVSWEDSEKTVDVESGQRKDCVLPAYTADHSLTEGSPFDWADDANEACQKDCQASVDTPKREEESAILKSAVTEPLVNAAAPSPSSNSASTWAKVLASPVKIQTSGSRPGKHGDAPSSKEWGDLSGESWAWERNWR